VPVGEGLGVDEAVGLAVEVSDGIGLGEAVALGVGVCSSGAAITIVFSALLTWVGPGLVTNTWYAKTSTTSKITPPAPIQGHNL
jgi:hypothetical protein